MDYKYNSDNQDEIDEILEDVDGEDAESTDEYTDGPVNPAEVQEEQPPRHAGLLFIIVAVIGLAMIALLIVFAIINKTGGEIHDVNMATTTETEEITTLLETTGTEETTVKATEETSEKESDTETESESELESETETEIESFETETDSDGRIHRTSPGFLENEKYPEFVSLMENYYGYMNNKDFSGLDKIIFTENETETKVNQSYISDTMEMIEEYRNIDVFISKGLSPDKFVVYVTYDIKFYSIDTLAPSLSRFYVTVEDDIPYIYVGEIASWENAFINASQNSYAVTKLAECIDEELTQAKKKDAKLKFLLNNLG